MIKQEFKEWIALNF
jgi:hypothetical protein